MLLLVSLLRLLAKHKELAMDPLYVLFAFYSIFLFFLGWFL